ncbi:MAG: hypothetical protein JNM24_03110 [Bdellovibrionaceae bacterium]|nr:hypothetical protein [Pseudobdellovibrionaceae bacterium]
MENKIESTKIFPRKAIKVILEFLVLNPKGTVYRGVQANDGSYRMEKRGLSAKRFKPYMWSGSIESLYVQQEILLNKPKL